MICADICELFFSHTDEKKTGMKAIPSTFLRYSAVVQYTYSIYCIYIHSVKYFPLCYQFSMTQRLNNQFWNKRLCDLWIWKNIFTVLTLILAFRAFRKKSYNCIEQRETSMLLLIKGHFDFFLFPSSFSLSPP